jgi:hypothetical protein
MREQLWKSLLIQADAEQRASPSYAESRMLRAASRIPSAVSPACNEEYFKQLVESNLAEFEISPESPGWEGSVAESIHKDVRRTFPGLKQFGTDASIKALWRVLFAYSIHDPEVGYCQVRLRRIGTVGLWL